MYAREIRNPSYPIVPKYGNYYHVENVGTKRFESSRSPLRRHELRYGATKKSNLLILHNKISGPSL